MDTKSTRKSYTAEFRRQAVAMVVTENLPLAEVAEGIHPYGVASHRHAGGPGGASCRGISRLGDSRGTE